MASHPPTDLPRSLPGVAREPVGRPGPRPEAVLVDVVALTADLDLFNAAREAVGERNPVWRARSAEEAADLLISGRCGVLLVDVGSVSASVGTLIEQIVEQFPDVVICVAGARADEPMLAPLISDGLVYRFMHKPATAKRAAMFLQAAIRRHVEQREGRASSDSLAPLLRSLRHPAIGWRKTYAGIALLLAIALALPFALEHTVFVERNADNGSKAATPISPVADPGTRADPVLSRARAALQAGRLDAPEGRNALDLFRAVLLAQPEHTEARAGLRRTIAALLDRADQDLQQGRTDAARDTVQRVLTVVPQDTRALALAARIDPPDTPSQQLAREQEADAAASRIATTTVVSAAPTTAPSPVTAITGTAQGGGPVLSAGPMPSAATQDLPTVRTRPPVDTTPRPDPLTPRYVNSVPTTAPRAGAPRRTAPRSYGAPIAPRHDTLGYVNTPAEPAVSEPPPPGPTLAADAFDRVYSREPEYPLQALRNGVGGWVELEFTITASGAVRDVQVVAAEPTGVFDAAARDALLQWRFKPRYVNGQPVAQRSNITLRFDVDRS